MDKEKRLEILRGQLKMLIEYAESLPVPKRYKNYKLYWTSGLPGYPEEYDPGDWLCDTNMDIAVEWELMITELKNLGMDSQYEAAQQLRSRIADLLNYTAEVWDNEYST